jgi:hypothetical protein
MSEQTESDVQQEAITYKLTAEELFFLAQMVKAGGIAGFQDPFQGYLRQELEDRWQKVSTKLLEKRILVKMPQTGEWTVDPMLGACVAVCGSRIAIQLEKYHRGQGLYKAHLHLAPKIVVEKRQDDGDEGSFVLTPIANMEMTLPVLKRFFPIDTLEEESFLVVLSGIHCKDVVRGILRTTESDWEAMVKDQGCPEKQLKELGKALAYPMDSALIRKMKRNGVLWEQQDLGFIRYGARLYLLTQSGDGPTTIREYQPSIVAEFIEQLAEVVEHTDIFEASEA